MSTPEENGQVIDLWEEAIRSARALAEKRKTDPKTREEAGRYEYSQREGKARAAGVPNDARVFLAVCAAEGLDTDAEQAATQCVQGYEADLDAGLYRARFLFLSADIGRGKTVGCCRAAVHSHGLSFQYLDVARLHRLHGEDRTRAENCDLLVLDEIGRDVSADIAARELILLRFNNGRLTLACGNVTLQAICDRLLDDPALLSRLEEQHGVYGQPYFHACKGPSLRERKPGG